MIQASTIAPFIEEADCRLTLHTNCRNTLRIAKASIAPLKNAKQIAVSQQTLTGDFAQLVVTEKNSVFMALHSFLAQYSKQYTSIVILSAKTVDKSILSDYVENDKYTYAGVSYPFATCRQFKGLEADVIILVDVDKTTLLQDSMLFYVGTSRARLQLAVVATLNDFDCISVAAQIKGGKAVCPPGFTPAEYLAVALHMQNKTI